MTTTIKGEFITNITMKKVNENEFNLLCLFEVKVDHIMYRGKSDLRLNVSSGVITEKTLNVLSQDHVDIGTLFIIRTKLTREIESLRKKIIDDLIEQELAFPFIPIHSVVFKNADSYTSGDKIKVEFKMKERPSSTFFANLSFSKEGIWRGEPFIGLRDVSDQVHQNYKPYPKSITFYDMMYDQIIDFLKKEPKFRVRTSLMENHQQYICDLYPKVKQKRQGV